MDYNKLNIHPKNFDALINGKAVGLYSIENKNGLRAHFTNFGQRLVALYVPNSSGNFEDIVLGFPNLKAYSKESFNYFGSVIGRYANRITKGRFQLNGNAYNMAITHGLHHMHGGPQGFHNLVWNVKVDTNCIEFYRISPDGEEGYPGNLDVRVRYLLADDNTLKISYTAKTDKTTVVNLTNHSFFNLNGEGNGSITDHVLHINAQGYTPVDQNMTTIGTIVPLKDTPMDFFNPKTIGKDVESDHIQMRICEGYDHNYVLNKADSKSNVPQLAATVFSPKSGRTLEVYTTEPGLQLYTSNGLDGTLLGKSGKRYERYAGFCLETQHFPDSPNHEAFPLTILRPGETYSSTTEYRFSTK